MAHGQGNFGKHLDGVMRTLYGLEYARYPEEYVNCYDVKTSTRAYEEALSHTGFGYIPQKTAGGPISFMEAKQDWLSRHIHVLYGGGFIVQRELWEDAQTNIISSLPKAFAASVRLTIEYIGADRYNNPTSTAAGYVLSDGKALLALDHPLGGGGSFKNTPTNQADLDATSLEQAFIDIGDFVDNAGLPMAIKPIRLIVPSELDWQTQKLLGSTQEPGSNYNDINPANGILPYSVNHYFTDPDAWFIKTNCPNGMVFYWRRRPEFGMENDWHTENALWKTTFRCVTGCDDPRSIYGSTGA